MGKGLLAILLFFTFCCFVTAQNVFVWAPNTFRLGSEETVGLTIQTGSDEVTLYLQDYPSKTKTFSLTKVTVTDKSPQIVRMKVLPENIPDLNLSTDRAKKYVYLVARGRGFQKEVKVLVGLQAGYLFLQTDKPIYTPKQSVHTRIIPLNEDLLQDNQKFTLQIRNPQDIIVENISNTDLKHLNSEHGMYSHVFQFPTAALPGEWSAVVLYGNKVLRNETVKFEMREYVLPTFEVKLTVPDMIFPFHNIIDVEVRAKYVYGEVVDGLVTCRFGVKSEVGSAIFFGKTESKTLQGGFGKCRVTQDDFKKHKQVGWFPRITGSRFVVEATVIERATGEEEKVVQSSTLFAEKKYLVDFKRSLKDFKPGLVATILADITDLSGKKVPGIPTSIVVKNQHNNILNVVNENSKDTSDFGGRVAYLVPTDRSITTLAITITTEDPNIGKALQGTTNFVMAAFQSGTYVALERTSATNSVKVGSTFASNVYSEPGNLAISYAVTSRGRIVALGALAAGEVRQRPFQLRITDAMVPSIRITLFAQHGGQTLTDSIKLDVENVCREKAKITIDSNFHNAQPGHKGKITIRGTENTVVGILGVDKAVYILRNQGLLTKEKMFAKMEEHDLGCGPGGGTDSQQVLANAGLVIITNTVVSQPERPSCAERRIAKRSTQEELMNRYDGAEARCCYLGTLKDRLDQNRTCEERAEIVRSYREVNDSELCAEAFLKCCIEVLENPEIKERAIIDGEILDFLHPDQEKEFEDDLQERKDFRELWLFQTGVIGEEGKYELNANLPDSITTWNVQAVAINPSEGMCVADPAEIVAFKPLFIQVRAPYSVVRNEQIELRATVFNYNQEEVPVTIYMYGVEGVCSEAQPGQQSERKKVRVPGNGGAQTIGFPVVPLQTGELYVKITAVSPRGGDIVRKKINVVAEGVPFEENIVFELDPSNLDRRKKRHVKTDKYETIILEEKKQQHSSVILTPSQKYIPGTEECIVTAIGDKFGVTIQTSLNNPGKLIRLPVGCGEQNMAYLSPTLYSVHYLKVTGKLTPQQEATGYDFIRKGYQNQLNFRKIDGSYGAWITTPSSTWLTAFVAKVFCQAQKYVYIDDNSICSALDWLTKQQNADGSFTEKHPIYHKEMLGGITGVIPMTGFVVSAISQCECKIRKTNVEAAKADAVAFLVESIPALNQPYQLAISTYAIALTDQKEAANDANERLLELSRMNDDLNQRYWGTPGTPLSIETTSFALLAQLALNNLDTATSIVNWLNTQRTTEGAFWSTQDTVIAIEALSKYAILSKDPYMSLDCNISSTVDTGFKETFQFTPENARVQRSYEIKKVSGRLQFEAMGTGVSTLGVKLRYNIPNKEGDICKFDIDVNVTEAKAFKPENPQKERQIKILNSFPKPMVEELGINLLQQDEAQEFRADDGQGVLDMIDVLDNQADDPRHRFKRQAGEQDESDEDDGANVVLVAQDIDGWDHHAGDPPQRVKRQDNANDEKRPYVANITICVKYLHHQESNMAVVDVGIFTGFKPNNKDLANLKKDKTSGISSIEERGRSLVFYVDKIPNHKPLCFSFRASREFLVGSLESSVVKVYDYYQPNHTCSKFYSPSKNSAVISTICEGAICRCAEGGCPKKNPFEFLFEEKDHTKRKSQLVIFACDKHDYVWKVKVINVEKDQTSFLTLEVEIIRVLKEGRETKAELPEKTKRHMLVRQTCDSGKLTENGVYIIMGIDPEPIEQADGSKKFNYFLNKQTSIYEWLDLSDQKRNRLKTGKQKNLQKIFSLAEAQFRNEGCLD